MTKAAPQHMPWAPAHAEIADVAALKALAQGAASDVQQKRAMKWIIENAAGTYDMTFHPESDRASAFAEGKRSVGRQIVGYVNIDMEKFRQAEQRKAPDGDAQSRSTRSRRKRSG